MQECFLHVLTDEGRQSPGVNSTFNGSSLNGKSLASWGWGWGEEGVLLILVLSARYFYTVATVLHC